MSFALPNEPAQTGQTLLQKKTSAHDFFTRTLPIGYGSPAPSYDAPAPSYSSPASTYGLRNQDLYYLYPEAFQNVDENFGNVDLTQTQNDYLTRLLSSNSVGTGQGYIGLYRLY